MADSNPLKYRIQGVGATGAGTSKLVTVLWFIIRPGINDEPIEVALLNDQVAVPPQATNGEIVERLERRRGDLSLELKDKIPNPETNQGLVGLEG